jgi:hypothetical protein
MTLRDSAFIVAGWLGACLLSGWLVTFAAGLTPA